MCKVIGSRSKPQKESTKNENESAEIDKKVFLNLSYHDIFWHSGKGRFDALVSALW